MLTTLFQKEHGFLSAVLFILLLLMFNSDPVSAEVLKTIKASVSSEGIQGNERSYSPRLSGNGERVVFTSFATNLVANDTNGVSDVFVYDRISAKTIRVSTGIDDEANGNSASQAISENGRYVVFTSLARNLVENDTNQFEDVFLYDFDTGKTELISVTSDGNQVYDHSGLASVSNDGRFVVFVSSAEGRFDSNDTNNVNDIYLRDRITKTTRLISRGLNGESSNADSNSPIISDDGRFILFFSQASNLINKELDGVFGFFVFNIATEKLEIVSIDDQGTPFESVNQWSVDISGNGRYVAFSGVSPSSSSDNIESWYSTSIYLRDRETGVTERVSQTPSGSTTNSEDTAAAVSDDGRYIVYQSFASDIVENDINEVSDIFVFDRETKTTERVNLDQDNNQLMNFIWSYDPSISNDSQFVTYSTNMLGIENNDVWIAQLDSAAPEIEKQELKLVASVSEIDPFIESEFSLDIYVSGTDIYGLEVNCFADPAIVNNSEYGEYFDSNSRLEISPIMNSPQSGDWMGSLGLIDPAVPISGSGKFATVYLSALTSDTHFLNIHCTADAANILGQPIALASGDAQIIINDGVHTPEGATLSGKITLPAVNDHSGILVTITAGDSSVSTVTNRIGEYRFVNLVESTWTVEYSHPQFESRCRNEQTMHSSHTVVGSMVMADADINDDGVVDLLDFAVLLFKYGQTNDDTDFLDVGDFNRDGQINMVDLIILGSHYDMGDCD